MADSPACVVIFLVSDGSMIPGKPSRQKSKSSSRRRVESALEGSLCASGGTLLKIFAALLCVYVFSFWSVVAYHHRVVQSERHGPVGNTAPRSPTFLERSMKKASDALFKDGKSALPSVRSARVAKAIVFPGGDQKEKVVATGTAADIATAEPVAEEAVAETCPKWDVASAVKAIPAFAAESDDRLPRAPWLLVVVPVTSDDLFGLRSTVRSIAHELQAAHGGLFLKNNAVHTLIMNFGGAQTATVMKRVQEEEFHPTNLDNGKVARAFTFVTKTAFPGCVRQQAVLSGEGLAVVLDIVGSGAYLQQGADQESCHAFLPLAVGDTFCQLGLLFSHYALAKADEYHAEWTSVRMSDRSPLAGNAWRCQASTVLPFRDWVLGQADVQLGAAKQTAEDLTTSYASTKSEVLSPMVYRKSLVAGRCGNTIPGYSHCQNNDISPCTHSHVDTHLDYGRIPYLEPSAESTFVLGNSGQSCADACHEKTRGKLVCDGADTGRLNTCYNLRSLIPCSGGCVPNQGNVQFPGVTVDATFVNGAMPRMPGGRGAGALQQRGGVRNALPRDTCIFALIRPDQTSCVGGIPGIRRACACTSRHVKGSAGEVQEQALESESKVFASNQGQSCNEACQKHGMKCLPDGLVTINTCNVMYKLFNCSSCDSNEGGDQPAFVANKKRPNHGECLLKSNQNTFTCQGKHPDTARACKCYKISS